MKKITNLIKENRSLKFLGILFLVGAIGIGVMTLVENKSIFETPEKEIENSNHNDLQNNIEDFNNKYNWNLSDYNVIEAKINTSANVNLISGTTRGHLMIKLNDVFRVKTFNRCELYLASTKSDNPAELKELLNKLTGLLGSNRFIVFYKTQIDKYNYYENLLPKKINQYVSDPINYKDEDNKQYSNEVKDMPGLDAKYKQHSKFKNLSNSLILKLDKFQDDHYKFP